MGLCHDIGRCVDCGVGRKVRHLEWIRASPPRCHACGGRLEESKQAHGEHARHDDEAYFHKARMKRKTEK